MSKSSDKDTAAAGYVSPAPSTKIFSNATVDSSVAFVAALDIGTSSCRIIVFNSKGEACGSAQAEFEQLFPNPGGGWHEHHPTEIYDQTMRCVEALAAEAPSLFESGRLKGVGITNMRETTVVWNAKTGKPYYNAIVWDDVRTADIAKKMEGSDGIDRFRDVTGLPLSTYFSATKMRWLIENVPELQRDLKDKEGNVRFGTIDTWIIYLLTGGASEEAAAYVTDITNASRTLLMNLGTKSWDENLIDAFFGDIIDFPTATALPKIISSSEVIAPCRSGAMNGVPIAGILGDQQAALFGQAAVSAGEAKCTYGTGAFLMMNTGTECVPSTHGLLTTPAYQLGPDAEVIFALEGSISHAGSVIQWLRDKLQIIKSAPESEILASSVPNNEGLYFVPAFAGLFAPYWRSDARGCLVGMTAGHHRGHVCRASLEASAYQARELLEAMEKDCEDTELTSLKVDGGMSMNSLLMQFQADMLNRSVVRPKINETTALGAAFVAGLATGVWTSTDDIVDIWSESKAWSPKMQEAEKEKYWSAWKKAVLKSFDSNFC